MTTLKVAIPQDTRIFASNFTPAERAIRQLEAPQFRNAQADYINVIRELAGNKLVDGKISNVSIIGEQKLEIHLDDSSPVHDETRDRLIGKLKNDLTESNVQVLRS